MKRLASLSMITLILLFCFSCKKKYTCKCTTAWTYQYKTSYQGAYAYNTEYFKGNDSPYSEKLTKKQASAACHHEQLDTESDFINGITDNGNVPFKQGESVTTDCSLILN